MKNIFTLWIALFIINQGFSQSFWTNMNSPTNAKYYAIDHTSANFYASNGVAGSSGLFYRKTGSGAWSTVTANIATGAINGLWSLNNGTLIASWSYTNMALYRSTDHGANWTALSASVTGANHNLIQDANNNVYVYNYTGLGNVSKSTDNGATWTIPNNTLSFKKLAVSGNTIYGISTGSGWQVRASTDGGVTWNLLPQTGYTTTSMPSNIAATPNGNIYLDNNYKSTTGGTTWTAMTPPPNGSPFFADYSDRYFVRNEPTNLYVSTDAGTTYTDVVNGLGLSPLISMQFIYPVKNGDLYVSTTGYALYKYGSSGSTGLNRSEIAQRVLVYPVPASDNLTVDFGETNTNPVALKLLDVSGKLVSSVELHGESKITIPTRELSPGIYTLNIKTNEESVNKKVIITE